ncbi:MAG: AI-2E family transporter [Actinomycetota bacterium]
MRTTGGHSVIGYHARAAIGVAIVAGLLWAAWTVRQVLLLILISFVLAVGMDPGVRFFQRRFKMRRGLATTSIMASLIVFLGVFLALIIPPIAGEVRTFASNLPGYIEDLQSSGGLLGDLENQFGLSERAEQLSEDIPRIARSSASTVIGFTRRVGGALFSLLTVLILLIYFMASLPRLVDGISALFPPDKREEYRGLLDKATEKIGGYVSGQLTVCTVAGISGFIAFWIIGLPFPAALAMLVAITTLIPAVGGLIGSVLCVLVALLNGVVPALITLGYMLVYQQVENYVISPRIMEKAVDLSPAAVLTSVLIGGSLLGFVGALLALPISAALKVVVRDLWLRGRLEQPAKRRAARPRTTGQGRTGKPEPAPAAAGD